MKQLILIPILLLLFSCKKETVTPAPSQVSESPKTKWTITWEANDNNSPSNVYGDCYIYNNNSSNKIYYQPFNGMQIDTTGTTLIEGYMKQETKLPHYSGTLIFKANFYTQDTTDKLTVWIYRNDTLIYTKQSNPFIDQIQIQ